MSDRDDDLLRAWRGLAGERGPTAIDPDEVVARAHRDASRERREWLVTGGATAFAIAVFMGLVAWKRTWIYGALAAFVLPVLVLLFAGSTFAHAAERRALSASIAEHTFAAVRRNRARVRLARASLGALGVLAAGFFAWLPFLAIDSERLTREPWRLAVGVAAALLVFGGAFVASARVVRTAREELERWEAVARSLE